jgi:PAS domain-containing protein
MPICSTATRRPRPPTLFLDRTLSVVRYTPQAAALFRLRESDSGRPLSDLTNRLAYPDLQADAQAVLAGRERIEREVASDTGCWYLVRILPYRPDGATEGVIITLLDITARRRAEQALRESETRFRALVTANCSVVYRRLHRGHGEAQEEVARRVHLPRRPADGPGRDRRGGAREARVRPRAPHAAGRRDPGLELLARGAPPERGGRDHRVVRRGERRDRVPRGGGGAARTVARWGGSVGR